MAQIKPHLVGHRYELKEQVGQGGMGTVYRALDHLSGQTVGLKRVTVAADRLQFGHHTHTVSGDSSDRRLALAQEFKVLASLRHPHIISVLDYGFDENRQPFFTMDMLDGTQTLVEAAKNQPLAAKINLLVQTLQALAYLHRRGVLHRDIKPDNVQVYQGQVKVLDFGLALASGDAAERNIVGTMAYIAPEVFQGGAPSQASDLYAIGVIAYEIFAGHRPYDGDEKDRLILNIMTKMPDVYALDIPGDASDVLARLLSKQPDDRYPDANAVIIALCQAIAEPLPPETAAIRESFLQAAAFVGRENEMKALKTALRGIFGGEKGSAWLIGGEVGVGKSRLVEELRTQALVEGALVLRGQTISERGALYHPWREVLRRLCLETELNETEAGVLKVLVPDIATLLNRDIPEIPALDPQAAQERLLSVVEAIFRRHQQPMVVILEDLHWAGGEVIALLKRLLRNVADQRLLLVGSYRDEERPGLAQELPGMQVLKLGRLTREAMAALCMSMLGGAGDQVLDLLERETEGNALFIIEVVRALAQEAGKLDRISPSSLPAHVFASGMEEVVRRRLARVPEEARSLLKMAAVAGRRVDLKVLQVVVNKSYGQRRATETLSLYNVDDWLAVCAGASVLEVQEGEWRFVHDKLRDVILADLSPMERVNCHRWVAEAIEFVFPGDKSWAAALFEHWYAVGQSEEADIHRLGCRKAMVYAVVAAEEALVLTVYREVVSLCQRGLSLISDEFGYEMSKMRLSNLLAEAYRGLSDYDLAEQNYQQSLILSWQLGDAGAAASALYGLGFVAQNRGDYLGAQTYFEQAVTQARSAGDKPTLARALTSLGLADRQADHDRARTRLEEALTIYREIDNPLGISSCLNSLGNLRLLEGDYQSARSYFEGVLAIRRKLGNRAGIGQALNNLGLTVEYQGQYAEARSYFEQSLALLREVGSRMGVAAVLCNLAFVYLELSDIVRAQQSLHESMTITREIGALAVGVEILVGYARLYLRLGETERALELLGLVTGHPATDESTFTMRIEPFLREVEDLLLSSEMTAALERGAVLDLETTMDSMLQNAG